LGYDDSELRHPVLIVDEDEQYCAFVTNHLSRAGYASHRVSTAADAIAAAQEDPPAAVLLEVSLPETCGYEICHELRQRHGDGLPIVFVSGDRTTSADRVAGLLVGADDYLLKPTDPDELVARLRRLVARAAVHPDREPGRGLSELTKRELEVLRLRADGMDQDTIANRLVISRATVATHIQRILKKLGVHSRAQAVAVAYREGVAAQAL
jgi:two-component system, NarL family, nitrate/nitrite response regulator NarL